MACPVLAVGMTPTVPLRSGHAHVRSAVRPEAARQLEILALVVKQYAVDLTDPLKMKLVAPSSVAPPNSIFAAEFQPWIESAYIVGK